MEGGVMRSQGRMVALLFTIVSGMASARPACAQDPLGLARAQLKAGHTDSALALLRVITDSGSIAPVPERVEAWILTGVARFYEGQDSGAAEAFRRAYALDPDVHAQGLAAMDSSLGALFEAQRPAPATTTPMAAAPGTATDSIFDCERRCTAGVSKPVLTYFPQITPADAPASQSQVYPGAGGLGPSGVRGTIVFRFVLTEAGSVDRGTLRITSSDARRWEQLFTDGLLQARFTPARVGGTPVKARVTLRVHIEAEGMDAFRYRFAGP
jgi:hypothetical protein